MSFVEVGSYGEPLNTTTYSFSINGDEIIKNIDKIKDKIFYKSLSPKEIRESLIKKVIFNYPAIIVFWKDGTKTVVKSNNEPYDKEKGLAMAFIKRMLGNTGKYNELFKEWC